MHNAPRVRLTLGVFSFIRTPLFTGKGSGSNFMTPLLHVETVSERMVNAVYSGYGSTIYLPGVMRYITSLVSLSKIIIHFKTISLHFTFVLFEPVFLLTRHLQKGGPQWLFMLLSHGSMKKAKLDFKSQAQRHDNRSAENIMSTEQTTS